MSFKVLCDYIYCTNDLSRVEEPSQAIEVYLSPNGEICIKRFGSGDRVYTDADRVAEALTGEPRILHYCCKRHWNYEIGVLISKTFFPEDPETKE